MSTQSLMGLVDYLCDTLSYEDMLFVSRKLTDCAMEQDDEQLTPYTMDEINAMLDVAEQQAETGEYVTHEDLMREWDQELAKKERLQKKRKQCYEVESAV